MMGSCKLCPKASIGNLRGRLDQSNERNVNGKRIGTNTIDEVTDDAKELSKENWQEIKSETGQNRVQHQLVIEKGGLDARVLLKA